MRTLQQNMMKKLPHPIQYQGSKRNLAHLILQYIPQHVTRFVEPFAGTAAMSIAMAATCRTQQFWINDWNTPLVELLKLIIEHPHDIADFYTRLWQEQLPDSINHYYHIREQFNRTQDPRLFLYLLARCVKGSVRYNSEGLFNQSPDKRRKGTQPATMRKNIFGVSRLLQGKCQFSSCDYHEMLQAVHQDDVVYMDPPYQGVCGERDARYASGIVFEEFIRTLERLNRHHSAFLVSYDGRRGTTSFGEQLPHRLQLKRIELEAGRSSQATLLGRNEVTIESLYLSSSLVQRLGNLPIPSYTTTKPQAEQLVLLESYGQYIAAT